DTPARQIPDGLVDLLEGIPLGHQGVQVELRTGRLAVQFQDGRASDRTADLPEPLPAGALRLADLGDWSLAALQAPAQQGVFWLSRLQLQTAVYDATGDRQELLAFLEAATTDTVEHQ